MAKVAGLPGAPAEKVTFDTFIRGLPITLEAIQGKYFLHFESLLSG